MKHQIVLYVLLILFLIVPSADGFAHGGGTDSKGGHYDRSTGQYHYHHGYSAHQHPNGVCPYERKETVTKGTTYSNSIISFPTATSRSIKVSTARPTTTIIRASSITPRPSATSYLRPAVTVAPGGIKTATPRATVKATSTPRVTSSPTQRPTASTSTPMYVADDMSHVWNYLMLGSVALVSICVSVHMCRSRSREVLQNSVVTEQLKNKVSKLISDVAKAKEELQHAYAEMAKLEQNLNEQQLLRQNAVADLHADTVAKQVAEQKLRQANAQIADLVQRQQEYQKRIAKLTEELKKSHEEAMPPKLMLVPPVPAPFPEVGDLHKFYSSHYPTTWNYIKTHALNEYSYLNYYHYVWGNLQINHGDGLVHGSLTEEQRALVNYPQPGKYIYLSSLDSPHYHNTSNCYALLRYHPIECNRSCADRYAPCTKCVNQ